jgi:hypothetical protein
MLSIFLRNLLLMLLFFSAISACKKDDNPAGSGTGGGGGNSFTINGSGWNNVTYTVPSATPPGVPFNPFALGLYNTSVSSTIVVNIGSSGSDSTIVTFGFQSRQVGNFQGNSPVARAIQVFSRGRNFIGGFETNIGGFDTTLIPNTTFNLNVTRYEAVGGRIQGSYTGTLREVNNTGGFGTATITITGNFDVLRLPDDFDGGGDVLQRRLFTHEK